MNSYYKIISTIKLKNILKRIIYEIKIRSGIIEYFPSYDLLTDPLEIKNNKIEIREINNIWCSLINKYNYLKRNIFTIYNRNLYKILHEDGNNYLNGYYQYFSKKNIKVDDPINFNKDYINDLDWPVGIHWRHYAKSGPTYNDIKLLWEPSRLSALFLLIRIYAIDKDEIWLNKGCDFILEWFKQNPPELTGNWACGQENSYRLFSILFFVLNLPQDKIQNDIYQKIIFEISLYAWRVGTHIEYNIIYAISQNNNHAITESIALWIIGLLFPIFQKSKHWIKKGQKILLKELDRQVYNDGSYVQHSMNYHRLVLDDMLFLTLILRLFDKALPDKIFAKFKDLTLFLSEFIDAKSGKTPNYGNNDGANILPLSCSDYTDFRPVLQASWYALFKKRFYEPGPWDEKMLWLFGEKSISSALSEKQISPSVSFNDGGYYILRDQSSWCIARCHSYRDRPGQADMLHLDLWHSGYNIITDSGTYRYYTDDSTSKYFKSTKAHNTITINGQNQMEQGPGFLWFNWTKSKLISFNDRQFEGEHYSYKSNFNTIHRRKITNLMDDCWEVVDTVYTHRTLKDLGIISRYHLISDVWKRRDKNNSVIYYSDLYKYSIILINTDKIDISISKGWQSLYYGDKQKIPVIEILHIGKSEEKEVEIKTYFGPSDILLKKLGAV